VRYTFAQAAWAEPAAAIDRTTAVASVLAKRSIALHARRLAAGLEPRPKFLDVRTNRT
jgi:hypothetical protein